MSSKSRCKSPEERLFKLTLERSQQSSDQEQRHRPWDRLLTHRPYLTRVELATLDRELFYNKGAFALTGGHALSFLELGLVCAGAHERAWGQGGPAARIRD